MKNEFKSPFGQIQLKDRNKVFFKIEESGTSEMIYLSDVFLSMPDRFGRGYILLDNGKDGFYIYFTKEQSYQAKEFYTLLTKVIPSSLSGVA